MWKVKVRTVLLMELQSFNDNSTLVVLSFGENESYTENCVLTLLGGAVPERAHGELLPTQLITPITPYSPPSRRTGLSDRSAIVIPTSMSYAFPFLLSIRLTSRRVPQDPLECLLLRRRRYKLYKSGRFQLRYPLEYYRHDSWPTQSGTIRALHRAEHVCRWRRRRTGLCRVRFEHQLYRGRRAPVNLTAQNQTVPWLGAFYLF
jgi:hypothetical protein